MPANDQEQPSRYPPIPRADLARQVTPTATLGDPESHSAKAQAHAVHARAFVDWKQIGRQAAKVTFDNPAPITVSKFGEVVIVVDDGSLTSLDGELDYIAVWDQVRAVHGDSFDFLTFFTDFAVPFQYSFWSAIFFGTQGISPYSPTDQRNDWNTDRLQGFHYINPVHIDMMGVYLQEFGHQWGSYVYYAPSATSEFVYGDLLLDGEPGHWDFFTDDAHSPMNYDFQFTPYMSSHWTAKGGNPAAFDYHASENIKFCDLDLYLMGLLPPDKVEPFYFILGEQQVGPQRWTGQEVSVNAQMVINAMGARQAPDGLREKGYRDAWVLVTRDLDDAAPMAAKLNEKRKEFELRYHMATRCLDDVDTSLP